MRNQISNRRRDPTADIQATVQAELPPSVTDACTMDAGEGHPILRIMHCRTQN